MDAHSAVAFLLNTTYSDRCGWSNEYICKGGCGNICDSAPCDLEPPHTTSYGRDLCVRDMPLTMYEVAKIHEAFPNPGALSGLEEFAMNSSLRWLFHVYTYYLESLTPETTGLIDWDPQRGEKVLARAHEK